MAMVAPWEQQTGAKVQYTGTRDINAVLSTGVQSGLLPDLAGLPGPGQMAEYYAAGALKSLDDTLDVTTYKSQTSPGLVSLGTIDGKITGIFIKADIKGLFWYNKDVYKAGDPTSYDDLLAKGKQTAASHRRRRQDLLHRPRVGRGDRLAGHRLDRGLRPPPERSGRLRQVDRRQAEVVLAGDQAGLPVLRRRRRQRVRRLQERPGHQLRRVGRPPLLEPARVRLRQPRDVHHGRASRRPAARSRTSSTSSRSRTSTRRTPAPSKAPATCSACSTTRRRPSR